MATYNLGKASITSGGEWSAALTYNILTAVSHNGGSYLSTQINSAVEPGVTSGWQNYWLQLTNGIAEVSKATSGLVDTYTITFTDGSEYLIVLSNGAAATIVVGTVSTGLPGTAATVTNSGDENAAVLDFVIPQGRPFLIYGYYGTYEELEAGVTSPELGMVYGVGSNQNYVYYVYATVNGTPQWVDIGALVPSGAVLYDQAMTLTGSQQQQARENIGAASDQHAPTHAEGGSDPLSPEDIGAATSALYTASFPASGWSSEAPYTQTVSVSGLLATDTPIYGLIRSTTQETRLQQQSAWDCVTDDTVAENSLTLLCDDAQPQNDFTIQILCVR